MTDTKPVIFLAFANSSANPLPNLAEEYHRLEAIGKQIKQKGHCELVVAPYATVDDILGAFQDERYRGRIALFHYAGHADSYSLLLQDAAGQPSVVDAGGLAAFLGHQTGLQLVFLNGCSTQPQVQGLLDAGVAVVIATSQAINDQVATDFAARFYQFLADGDSIGVAFDKAQAALQIAYGNETRNLFLIPAQDAGSVTDRWPWDRYVRPGAETALRWNLPDAANDPLFGLPPIPEKYYHRLPDNPFRGLTWFATEHAALFFGRGYQIRALYQQLVTPHTPPLLLFYGQSGVGKSSLLAAGLTPRLEGSHALLYLRRDQKQGLLGALQAALRDKTGATQLADAWSAIEAEEKRPLLVILDQAEEVFTRTNLDQPRELADFLDALQALGADPKQWPQGKLILSFRKEWLAEIKRQVEECKLPHTELFLQRLDKRGVIEAIAGPIQTPALQAKYRLAVAGELPGLIADDLLADPDSAVAPTLQILLTKLWEAAKARAYDQPTLDEELYRELRKQGLGLGDILDQQMKELGRRQSEVVASGLALDLLAFHTTSLGTAKEHTRADLQQTYAHCQEALEPLVQECGDLYLLVDPARNEPTKPPVSRLAHDTLAPLVRRRFAESDAPGQRARRILENRAVDWENGKEGTPLDDADLKVVEEGSTGTRAWKPAEEILVTASRAARAQRRREARNRKWSAAAVSVIILLAVGVAVWFGADSNAARKAQATEEALRKVSEANATAALMAKQTAEANERLAATRESEARTAEATAIAAKADVERLKDAIQADQLTTKALQAASENPQQALLLAVEGLRPLTGVNYIVAPILTNMYELLDQQSRIPLTATLSPIVDTAFSPHGRWLAAVDEQGGAYLWDLQNIQTGRPAREIQGAMLRSAAFSPDERWFAALGSTGELVLQDLRDLVASPTFSGTLATQSAPLHSVAFSADSNWLVIAAADATLLRWNLESRQLDSHRVLKASSPIVLNSDGQWLITTSQVPTRAGYSLVLWEEQNNALEHHFATYVNDSIGIATVSRDGRWLAAAGNRLYLWDSKEPSALVRFLGYPSDIQSISFGADERWVATIAADGVVRLWNVEATNSFPVLLGATAGNGRVVEMSPDGEWLVAAYKDGSIFLRKLWKLDVKKLKEATCELTKRNLTEDEWRQFLGGLYRRTCDQWPADEEVITSLLNQAEAATTSGSTSEAITIYEQVLSLDPSFHYWSEIMMHLGLNGYAEMSKEDLTVTRAVLAKMATISATPGITSEVPAIDLRSTCKSGALSGAAAAVLWICDRAVSLSLKEGKDKESKSHDRRGVARALTGDSQGSIEDFEFTIQWAKETGNQKEFITRRKAWIAALKAGQNPFDAAMLEQLRNE